MPGAGVSAVEIVDHHVDVLEIGLRGPGGDFDREAAGTLEHALNGAGSGRPIVIVHAVDDERGEFGRGGLNKAMRETALPVRSRSIIAREP